MGRGALKLGMCHIGKLAPWNEIAVSIGHTVGKPFVPYNKLYNIAVACIYNSFDSKSVQLKIENQCQLGNSTEALCRKVHKRI